MADPTKTHVVKELKHDSPIISCRFDPGGKFVFFGAQDYHVWRWDWQAEAKTQLTGHDAWVRGLTFSADGQTLITGGYDGKVSWWDAMKEEPKLLRTIDAHDGWVRAVAVSPQGDVLATAGNDKLVKLWNAQDGKLIRSLAGHECHVYNLAFHPSGEHLVSGDLKARLIHWDVASGEKKRELKAESLYKYDKGFRADIGGFRGLTFSADGKLLAGSGITNVTNAFAGVGNPAIVVLDWESGEQKIQHESKAKHKGVAWGVAFHPENFTIGISGGSGGGYLLFWKPDQKEEFHQLKFPNTARDLDLAPDGIHVVTGHYDRHIRVSKLAEKAEA